MEECGGQTETATGHDAGSSARTRLGRLLDPRLDTALRAIGATLLVLWCIWWVSSLSQGKLVSGHRLWFQPPCFGIDFLRNVDTPTRIWMAGDDPYADKQLLFCYPPLVTRLFAWSTLMTPQQALVVWVGALALMAGAGAWAAWRTRARLGLPKIPPLVALVAVLLSSPVMFAMERGNYDLLAVPLVIGGVALMKRRTGLADVAAGIVLAIAPWAKVYPGLLAVGLLGLRRWRVLAAFCLAGLAIGLADLDQTRRWLENNDRHMAEVYAMSEAFPHAGICAWQHSLTECWKRLWLDTPLALLARIPGSVAAACLLIPLLAWVSYHVFRCERRSRLAFAYLIWILALATFVPPVSNDYNLVFLPIAALAVWDRRDPLIVHLIMLAVLLWWQPLSMPIDGRIMLLVKLAGLAAVGVSLAERACDLSQVAGGTAAQRPELSPPRRAAA